MKDNYPTRLHDSGRFFERKEVTAYYKSKFISETQFDFYVDNGFLKIDKFFNILNIEACLEKSKTESKSKDVLITNEPEIEAIRSLTGVHLHEPFNTLYRDPALIDIVKGIVGGQAYIHQSRINYKSGISSNGWYWHSDFETWHAQDGMPAMRCVSAMIPLTENTECNGSLMVIPKSHELFYSCKKEKTVSAEENFADQKEGVPDVPALYEFFKHSKNKIQMIKCSPGDVVLFDCNLIHVSNPNMTPLPRTNLFFVFNSVENKLQKPFSVVHHRPMQMATTEIKEVL